tara:strand:+ start:921 stop:1055 length:135 start_codon:yes stop_codon:yes gene_type:complete
MPRRQSHYHAVGPPQTLSMICLATTILLRRARRQGKGADRLRLA